MKASGVRPRLETLQPESAAPGDIAKGCPAIRRVDRRHLAQLAEALGSTRAFAARIEFMSVQPVDLADKLSQISEHWTPKVVARLNDYEVKLVKLAGEFVWHSHQATDELFLVIDGELTIQLRDSSVRLSRGQLFVVPRGVE